MKFSTFTYTKANKEVSPRVVLVVRDPSKLLSGIDVSGLSSSELAAFTQSMRELENRHAAERNFIIAQYSLSDNFRQFSPERITDRVDQWA